MEFLDEIIDLLNSGEFQKIIDSIGDFLDENPAYKTIDYHHFANPLEEMLFDNYLEILNQLKHWTQINHQKIFILYIQQHI